MCSVVDAKSQMENAGSEMVPALCCTSALKGEVLAHSHEGTGGWEGGADGAR